MKALLLLLLSFQCLAAPTHSIFLSTHAESKHIKNDPPLSQCGRLRAQQLSTLLTYSNIENVYSTTDMRTMQTANPTAQKNNVPVKVFTTKLLDSVAITAINQNKNILIIGDNETITFLVEFISKQQLDAPKKNYQQMLYQIIMVDGQPILNVLKQPLQC
jgi:phosphohistidine phosphatase SixA